MDKIIKLSIFISILVVSVELFQQGMPKTESQAQAKEYIEKPLIVNTEITKEEPIKEPEFDPSGNRSLYRKATEEFGIPWQLIEAIHQIETGKSDNTDKCSSAGACGPMQFMPNTWEAYKIDGNGDGLYDITDKEDSVFAAAHYLARSGADDGKYREAIFNYNHADWYVDKVMVIAEELGL